MMDVTVASLLTIILITLFHVHIIATTDTPIFTSINHAGTREFQIKLLANVTTLVLDSFVDSKDIHIYQTSTWPASLQ